MLNISANFKVTKMADHIFFNFNNSLFLDKDCGHKLTHTNKNEISINLFPVCYQSLSIIFFCSRLVKSHTPQRFALRHCLKINIKYKKYRFHKKVKQKIKKAQW